MIQFTNTLVQILSTNTSFSLYKYYKSTNMIMSFCKNTLHSFLGIPHHRDTLLPSPSTTAGLNSITKDDRKPPNIIESASVKPSSTTTSGGGSLHEITSCCGGGGSSLMSSCTESLGLESSEQMEEEEIVSPESKVTPVKMTKKTRIREEPVKKFPPILSSLRRKDGSVGECKTSFLKPVRENGRLILTQVTINRPEVFRASRQDGRLRLQFIKREEKSPEKLQHEKQETWPVKYGGGGGEGLSRCNELNHHQQHHHHRRNRNQLLQMPLWNQQCVTSR